MGVLLCLSVLLVVAGSAPAPGNEVSEALADASVNLSIAAMAAEETAMAKRGVCTASSMRSVAVCFYGIPQKLLDQNAYGSGPCNVRELLQSEFGACARKYGCEDNTYMIQSIQTGMRTYDDSIKARGYYC